MKLLVITQIYPQPDDEGDDKPTRTVEYFAREWVNDGHNVLVIHCPSRFPTMFYFIPSWLRNWVSKKTNTFIPTFSSTRIIKRKEFGIRVIRHPLFKLFPGMAYSKKRISNYSDSLCKYLDKHEFVPDVVLGHFANPSLEIVANVAEYYNARSSIVFHKDCGIGNIKKYRIKENINRVSAVGTRSIMESREVYSKLDLKEAPFVCYSGVPNNLVKEAMDACDRHSFDNEIVHLFVGGMIKRKCLYETIVAFNNVYKDNNRAFLRIIGGGPEEKNIKNAIASMGNSRINLLGTKNRDDVQKEMKKTNVFTMISKNETFGMVYLEAMLQGCIVIASFGGGFDGIIQNGVNGFLCEAGNIDMLSDVYRHINSLTKEERNIIGNNAIETAKKYSERNVALRYLQDVINRNN